MPATAVFRAACALSEKVAFHNEPYAGHTKSHGGRKSAQARKFDNEEGARFLRFPLEKVVVPIKQPA
jgi:hypothetical protein